MSNLPSTNLSRFPRSQVAESSSTFVRCKTAIAAISAVAVLFLPGISRAQILITEIMYDLSGTDSAREWVEIKNTSANEIDLLGWKFYDGANHVLNEPPKNGGRGSLKISSGEFAIFASDAPTFISENPEFSGTVIDTVMSLPNTTGNLKVINADGLDVDTISYTSETGAEGDGNTLNRSGDSLIVRAASPGKETSADSFSEPEEEIVGQRSKGERDIDTLPPPKKQIAPDSVKMFVDAGGDRTVMVGADVVFKAATFGARHSFSEARFYWNFGDGETAWGQTVIHNFLYPGNYAVVLYGHSGQYEASDFVRIKAIPSPVSISNVAFGITPFVGLKNESSTDLDISLWHLRVDELTWSAPRSTYILKNSELNLSAKRTGLYPKTGSKIELIYPNGEVAYTWSAEKKDNKNSFSAISAPIPRTENIYYENAPLIEIEEELDSIGEGEMVGLDDSLGNEKMRDFAQSASVNEADVGFFDGEIIKWLVFLSGLVGLVVFFLFYFGSSAEITSSKAKVAAKSSERLSADEFEIEEELL